MIVEIACLNLVLAIPLCASSGQMLHTFRQMKTKDFEQIDVILAIGIIGLWDKAEWLQIVIKKKGGFWEVVSREGSHSVKKRLSTLLN